MIAAKAAPKTNKTVFGLISSVFLTKKPNKKNPGNAKYDNAVISVWLLYCCSTSLKRNNETLKPNIEIMNNIPIGMRTFTRFFLSFSLFIVISFYGFKIIYPSTRQQEPKAPADWVKGGSVWSFFE